MTDRQLCSLLYRDDLDLKHATRKRLQKELQDCKSKQIQLGLQRQKTKTVFDELQDGPATMHLMEDDDDNDDKLELDGSAPIAKALIDYITQAGNVRGDTEAA